MTNSEPQITDADRAAAEEIVRVASDQISKVRCDSSCPASLTYTFVERVIADAMAPEREAMEVMRAASVRQHDSIVELAKERDALQESIVQLEAKIDEIIGQYRPNKWGGDTAIERLANAMCDIHTCVECGGCGVGVRSRYAMTKDALCHKCASKRLDAAEKLAEAAAEFEEFKDDERLRDWLNDALSAYRAAKGKQ